MSTAQRRSLRQSQSERARSLDVIGRALDGPSQHRVIGPRGASAAKQLGRGCNAPEAALLGCGVLVVCLALPDWARLDGRSRGITTLCNACREQTHILAVSSSQRRVRRVAAGRTQSAYVGFSHMSMVEACGATCGVRGPMSALAILAVKSSGRAMPA
jgi:hypothetical protein